MVKNFKSFSLIYSKINNSIMFIYVLFKMAKILISLRFYFILVLGGEQLLHQVIPVLKRQLLAILALHYSVALV